MTSHLVASLGTFAAEGSVGRRLGDDSADSLPSSGACWIDSSCERFPLESATIEVPQSLKAERSG